MEYKFLTERIIIELIFVNYFAFNNLKLIKSGNQVDYIYIPGAIHLYVYLFQLITPLLLYTLTKSTYAEKCSKNTRMQYAYTRT